METAADGKVVRVTTELQGMVGGDDRTGMREDQLGVSSNGVQANGANANEAASDEDSGNEPARGAACTGSEAEEVEDFNTAVNMWLSNQDINYTMG